MESAVIRRGIIQAFNPANWTATVQVLPSQGNYLVGVPVAKHLLAAEIALGDECAILFFNELNPADAMVIAVYSVPSAAPGPPLTSLAGGVGGAALTGDVRLVPGPSGSVSISESGQQIIIDASGGSGSPPQVSTSSSTVTISDTALHTLNTLSLTPASSTTYLIVGTILFKYSVANAGLFLVFQLDGALVGPIVSSSTGGIVLVKQTSAAEEFTIAFFLTIAAGSHTLTLDVAEAVASGTATISWSQLAVKAGG